MKQKNLLVITALFSVLGIADALYLAEHALTKTALSCGIDTGSLSGCNVVAQSSYSHFFGIPLGVYGVIFYGLVFVCTCISMARSQVRMGGFLLLLGILGAVFSIYFVGIQILVIDAICIYCLGSALLSFGIFVTTLIASRNRSVRGST